MLDKVKKPGWRQVKFGDVVRQVKEKVEPETSGLERYVAGDHMDTDDLRIRRWGEIGSGYLGPAFHMRFRPGQVLYGSRRTYLRKVAVADFDGICANTTFVIEPKNAEELLPEFLPFLMQTDAFNEFSVKNSKGSVNPYINFSDLARFEFALPPLDVQARLADTFYALDEQIEALEGALQSSRILKSALAERTFPVAEVKGYLNAPERYSGRKLTALRDLGTFQVGYPFKSAEYSSEGDRLLRGSNVGVNRLNWDADITCYWPAERRTEVSEYVLAEGDIVVAMDRPFISDGFKIARIQSKDLPALLLQRVGRFKVGRNVDASYLWAFLHSESFKWQLQRMQKGTDLPHISKFDIEGTLLPELTIDDQVAVAERFSEIERSLPEFEKRIASARHQRKLVLHAALGEEV